MLGTASSPICHDHHPDDFTRQTGWRGFGSCIPFALCVVMGDALVPGNDMMAYTISVMAAGRMC